MGTNGLFMNSTSEVIGSVSESMQWKIPNFFTAANNLKRMSSPIISSFNYQARLYLDFKSDGKLCSSLVMKDPKIGPEKTVMCYFGEGVLFYSKKAHILETETPPPAHTCNSKIKEKIWQFTSFFGLDELKRRKSKLVPHDKLTITFYIGDYCPQPLKEPERLSGLEDLSSSFHDLFARKKQTDTTIIMDNRSFPVHKAVLVARSSVFSAMFENDTSEAQTGVVTLPDCYPDSFVDFLRYLYTGKFDGVTSSNAHHLYITAHKYDVQPLKSFCVPHMIKNITVENVLDIATLASQYEESELLSAAQDFFNHNFGKVISASHWSTLLREDPELANKLLLHMESKMKLVEK